MHIKGRIDDVFNVAGHRLESGRIEEAINSHPSIGECAVVGIDHEAKGQVPIAFINVRDHIELTEDAKQELTNQINLIIREDIGPIARLEGVLFAHILPKTKTGKIMRRMMLKIMNGEDYKYPPTIEDASAIDLMHSFSDNYDKHVFVPD